MQAEVKRFVDRITALAANSYVREFLRIVEGAALDLRSICHSGGELYVAVTSLIDLCIERQQDIDYFIGDELENMACHLGEVLIPKHYMEPYTPAMKDAQIELLYASETVKREEDADSERCALLGSILPKKAVK